MLRDKYIKISLIVLYVLKMVTFLDYYSAIKRNEIVLFAETWMDLENVIQNEVRKRKTTII